MDIPVYNLEGKQVGIYTVPDELLDVKINKSLIHQVIVAHLSNKRQGTHSTKTRKEVRGGGRKPWAQKGTGRARHGSIRAPQWRGGGKVHTPKPLDWDLKINKNMRRQAIKMAWIDKIKSKSVVLLDRLEFERPKTKQIHQLLKALDISGEKILLLMREFDHNVYLSARNLPNVFMLPYYQPSTYDLINAEKILTTCDAMDRIVKERIAI
ncbi:MAG: 50S ribosomal protein L4 [Armatimonadota bacterium]|nr:50S ribosomal protein L4 [Armatimonadota bacterium]MCX7776932.1 50S ribosomal protein L4 [Armatimonadota bacterium]MDW8024765.1 50S ribosomal protein L4 [Armatimonadota bacterium]